MKLNNIAAVTVLLFLSGSVLADGATIFYRDGSGAITNESRQHASTMRDIAEEQGFVTLWVLFDLPLPPNPHNMTEEEMAAQETLVKSYADEVLGPMVSTNKVWHPEAGPMVWGLACKVRATNPGLSALFNDERIIQIVALDQ